jgi:hypothetical protein
MDHQPPNVNMILKGILDLLTIPTNCYRIIGVEIGMLILPPLNYPQGFVRGGKGQVGFLPRLF